MNTPDPTYLNKLFLAHMGTPEGKVKIAAKMDGFVRDKVREVAVFRRIIPPRKVERSELQVSEHNDTLIFMDEVEPNSRAMSITFRGQPTVRLISARRYPIGFWKLSSEEFQKPEEELLAYKMSLTKVIERNAILDVQEVEDYRNLLHVEAGVQATGKIIRGKQATEDRDINGAGTGFRGKIQREDLIDLANELDGNRRTLAKYLVGITDWNDISRWQIEDFGDDQAKVVRDGYPYDVINKRLVVRTIKTDILQPGNIYGFTDPEYLGKFLLLIDSKFYIDKVRNMLTFMFWSVLGCGIGNVASMAKLELYNGQGAGVDDSDSFISEEEVGGGVYNQVDDGIFFPHVSNY